MTPWLIAGFILLILELVIPGVFVMWWGLAALIVSGITFFFPDLSLSLQGVIFASFSVLFSLLWWQFQHNKDKREDQHAVLNQRDHAMLGTEGVVVELLPNGTARGKFGDTTWRVQSYSEEMLSLNQRISVVAVEGITLVVKAVI
ncbi:hypothetical protein A4G19_01020 [Pasteurellaceae bacterium Macca]|nr:hypothetical protein [Pasteurellaceae bacterium Macca]